MPKLRGPLLSLGARGRLAKLFSLVRRRGQHIIERKPIPTDAKSPAQLFNRHMFSKCVDLWHLLSEEEKQIWESLARPLHMTGYAWFISQCLRPNPGIYLPLQGGTMSGNIEMAKNRLLQLPPPTDGQEAATKIYVDTLSKIIWKDVSQTAMDDNSRTATLSWTVLDLTAYTSEQAKFAIVRLDMKARTVGTGDYCYLEIRKSGTMPTHRPRVDLHKAGTTLFALKCETAIIGLSNDRKVQYRIGVLNGWEIDTDIKVLGYIE